MKQHVDYQMLLADSRGAECQMSVDYTVAGGSQTGEVWIPVGEPPYPAIMFVHGGCWSSAFDLIHARGMCRAFADLGYWVWLPEYRRLGEPGGGWPATFDDIACAGEWLRQRSSEDIDPHRLYLVGHSAGGHLALWLNGASVQDGSKAEWRFTAPWQEIVGLAAITDLDRYGIGNAACQVSAAQLLQTAPPAIQATLSPMNHVMQSPVTLFFSEEDDIVSTDQARLFGERHFCQLEQIAGAGHFDFIYPESTAGSAVLEYFEQRLQ